MPLDARETRAKLVTAGAQLFATQGIHGAQMRDIVRLAGQANDSAVHYHFGSRTGLLRAICQQHMEAMERERERRLAAQGPDPDTATVIADLVRPTAEHLRTQEGRWFLQITAQLAGHAGVRSGTVPSPVVSAGLRAQLEQLREASTRRMPADVAGERVAILIGALTSAFAERAAATDAGTRFALDESSWLANLEAMLVAALEAPIPAVTS